MQNETQPFLIGSGLTIVGDIDVGGGLRIEGSVRGRVLVRGTLTVAPGAVVEGFVQAVEIDIYGRLSGVVRAEAEVRLHTDGQVTGDVEAPRVRFIKVDRPPVSPASDVARPAPPAEPEGRDRPLPPARSGHTPGIMPAWPDDLGKTVPVWAPKSRRAAPAPPSLSASPASETAEDPDSGPPAPPSITGSQRQIVVRRK